MVRTVRCSLSEKTPTDSMAPRTQFIALTFPIGLVFFKLAVCVNIVKNAMYLALK